MRLVLVLSSMLLSLSLSAHEGHDLPGGIPPAPHGGKLAEATEGKTEVYYEVVYQDKALKVYALGIPAEGGAFTALSPKKSLTKVSLKVELPRAKKSVTLAPKVNEEVIEAPFDAKAAKRFIVHISSVLDKEPRTAKIQVELN